MPVAQIDTDSAPVYLHSDHLLTPRMATNGSGTPVWRWHSDAFGNGTPDEDPDGDGQLTEIDLRFPGQYADSETGWYYNLHRYYDPNKGRYTQSDPLGLMDGTNSFAYVHGNPLSGVDPLGLYERDVHYYMTFFLGVTAGMTPEDARMMALATQYIDDNPATQPVAPGFWGTVSAPFINQEKLLKYHFTLWEKTGGNEDNFSYSTSTNILSPKSEQLDNLYSYAAAFPAGECGYSTNTRLQFMGEYLHAFEDTFAHRGEKNKPYEPLGWFGLGTGHALGGHDPDYTYNHKNCSANPSSIAVEPICDDWSVNEARTLEMERETYQKIRDYMVATNYDLTAGKGGRQTDFAALENLLMEFNATKENAGNTEDFTSGSQKVKVLQEWLKKNGYFNADGSDIEFTADMQGYDEDIAASNRKNNFKDAKAEEYSSAILPAG